MSLKKDDFDTKWILNVGLLSIPSLFTAIITQNTPKDEKQELKIIVAHLTVCLVLFTVWSTVSLPVFCKVHVLESTFGVKSQRVQDILSEEILVHAVSDSEIEYTLPQVVFYFKFGLIFTFCTFDRHL